MSDYAMVALTQMARAPRTYASCALAQKIGVPEPTVAKLLKALARGGILSSQRGTAGGYALARPASEISVADIIAALEGPIALTDCVGGHSGDCAVESLCSVRGSWDKINTAIQSALASVSLAEMAAPRIPAAFMLAADTPEHVA
jgi:FeS assembly SUF system regulator